MRRLYQNQSKPAEPRAWQPFRHPVFCGYGQSGPDQMITLSPDAFISPLAIDEAVTRALAEDFGRAGDVTTTATVPAGLSGRAVAAAREGGVISGLPLLETAFRKLAPAVRL